MEPEGGSNLVKSVLLESSEYFGEDPRLKKKIHVNNISNIGYDSVQRGIIE